VKGGDNMPQIGNKTLAEIQSSFNELIEMHQDKIMSSYGEALVEGGPGKLKIYSVITVNPSKKDTPANVVKTSINFVSERIKDEIVRTVDEQQESLPGDLDKP